MKWIQGLSEARLSELLEAMRRVRTVILGDMCLDIYWFADMTRSVLSRETPHYPLPVVEEKMSPGAGGNAVVNLSVLTDHLVPVGVVGRDWRGRCLSEILEEKGLSTKAVLADADYVTNAYCKPMRVGFSGIPVEDPRIDFENSRPMSEQTEQRLLSALDAAVQNADLLCVSDQFALGCVSDRVRERVNFYAASGLLTVVDSRYRIASYRDCILKPNEIECARALGYADDYLRGGNATEERILETARELCSKTKSSLCLTLGERGSLVLRSGDEARIFAIPTPPPIDIVGAGDCFLSAFSLALAAGADSKEAGVIASLASAVSVKKLNTTGSASREEIMSLFDRVATNEQ